MQSYRSSGTFPYRSRGKGMQGSTRTHTHAHARMQDHATCLIESATT
jgi:hypothetical protein